MDLSLVSESISKLLSTREYIKKIADLELQLVNLSSDFQAYKNKVKLSIRSFTTNYNLIISSKQHEIEKLQMQNAELRSLVSTCNPKESIKIQSEPSQIQKKILNLLRSQGAWTTLKSFLNSKDIVNILNTPVLKDSVLEHPEIFDHLTHLLTSPPILPAEEEKPPPAEQQDINILLEKYVKQQHIIGKNLEKKLTDAVPTLIRLYKSTGNTMPNQKFNSVSELILSIFPYDIVLEILIKSSSAFVKNSGSMNEWLSFLQNLLAGLITESALVYNEVGELTKLKNILADRLRKAKEQLKTFERENFYLKDEVKTLKEIRDHLVGRLHLTDINSVKKTVEIGGVKEELGKAQKVIKDLEEYIDLLKKSENGRVEKINSQVEVYKTHITTLNQQKQELILAFEDLGSVFKSFSLKLS